VRNPPLLRPGNQGHEHIRGDAQGLAHAPRRGHNGVTLQPASALGLPRVISYRARGLAAVELLLDAPAGALPWTAAGAELVGPGCRALRVLPPWQKEPIQSGTTERRVVLEAEATEQEIRGSFRLKMWNEDGTRSASVSGVTFPKTSHLDAVPTPTLG